MGDLIGVFAIFCIFVAPLWLIMHDTTNRRQVQGLIREDKKMLPDLWQITSRMEGRVKALATIPDTQTPYGKDKA